MKNITRYNKVEPESKNGSKLWQITVDAMSESIFLIDLDLKIVQCNKATLELLEKANSNEIIGHPCWRLIHDASRPFNWCPVKKMMQSGKRESIIRKLNGRWAEITAEPVFNDKGKISGAVHIIADINARKQAEDALIESQQQYLTILNSLSDAMHVVDKDLRIIYQNLAMTQWLKKLNLNSDVIGDTIFNAFPFLDYDKVYHEYETVFKKQKIVITAEVTKLSNRIIFTETRKIPIMRENEVYQIITILRDITEQKEAEEKLKSSEQNYKNIINNLMDIIIILDLKGKFLFVSPQIYDISGFTPEEIVGINGFKIMHPDDIKNAADTLKKAINTRKKMYIEFRTIHKDGHYIDVSASGRIVNIDGEDRIFAIIRDISVQKRSEQKIKESEEKFRNLFENSPNILILLDKNGIILDVNHLFLKSFGFKKKEIIGKDFWKIKRFNQENTFILEKKYKELMKKGNVEPFELETKNMEGNSIWVRIQASCIEIGEREFIQVIFQDITDKKVTELKLKESEEKYRLITENVNDMIGILNDKMEYEYINESAYLNVLGRMRDDLIGYNSLKWFHPDDIQPAIEAFKRGWENGEGIIQIRSKDTNDKYHWLEVKGTMITDQRGENKILIVARDISKRKEAELKLKESEEKYRLILENANDLIAILNMDFKHEYVNEQAHLKLLGYNKDEFINFTPIKFLHPDDVKQATSMLREGFQKGSGKGIFRFKCQNGKYKWLESRGTTFIDTNGEKKGLIISRDITESKEANERLKESEEMFRTIAEQSFMGIIIIQDGFFKYLNEQAIKINEYSVEEIQQWAPYEFQKLIYPDDREFVMEQARKKEAGDPDVITNYKYRGVKKNGDVIWVEIYSKSIIYKAKPADFVMTIDISEKIEAEERLKDSEEKYRLISENTDDLIVVYNENWEVEYLNAETHSRILGYNPKELKKKGFRDELIYKDDKEIADIKTNEGLEKGNYNYQFRLRHQNGKNLWFEVFGKTFIDSSNQKKILCISRNIDEKKIAENKIRESEENFRTIADQAFIGTLIIQDDKIVYYNDAIMHLFEHSSEEINNWRRDDLHKLIYPEDLQHLKERQKELENEASEFKQFYTYRVFTKYGKIKWIDQFSKKILYRGRPGILITIMDITNKKKAEEELIKLNKLKSELLRRTSHELKTPLVSIKGFSDLLLTVHKEKLDDYVLATIHEIKLGCERLENLIQDILKTSELESETVELKKQEEDLSFLIKLCIKELQGLIRLRNHEIKLEIHDRLVTWFEPDQIHLVLSNLFSNAIKYTPPDGKIKIKSAVTQDNILISIEDNGIGITNEEKKRLFSQFGKIERYGQGLDIISEGSGLGLYITKKIIELHGGTIRVKSKGRNKGSTFYFTLPIITKNKE